MGNWHEIDYVSGKGYVWEKSTEPATSSGIKNFNFAQKDSAIEVTAKKDVVVYDNTSGALVPYAKIKAGQKYPIISDFGPNWYKISIANRIGYIRSAEVERTFSQTDRYFKVTTESAPVYDNSTGKLIQMGTLSKNEVFERIRDYGNWHEIRFGTRKGYVWEGSSVPVSKSNKIKNAVNTIASVKTLDDVIVYDNSTGTLMPFAEIKSGVTYPVIKDFGPNWFEVHLAGRVGYIHKKNLRILSQSLVNPKQLYTYDLMQKDIGRLATAYPDLIKTQIIGKSVDGRNLYAVKLGKGKTEVFFNGSHHAREHITTNLIMEMIDEYARAYVDGHSIGGFNVQSVLNQTSIWFVPMVNPDGVTLVQKGYLSAKNPSHVLKLNKNSKDFSAWKANIRGVDLNRQYPADWSTIKYDPGRPGPQNFKGSNPLSEPETRAVSNFTLTHQFKLSVSYHTAGQIIYWNFKQVGPNYHRDLAVAKKLATKTGYSLAHVTSNPSGGGYKDWFIIQEKKPSFTIELAPYLGAQPVNIKYFDSIWKQNDSIGLMVAWEALRL